MQGACPFRARCRRIGAPKYRLLPKRGIHAPKFDPRPRPVRPVRPVDEPRLRPRAVPRGKVRSAARGLRGPRPQRDGSDPHDGPGHRPEDWRGDLGPGVRVRRRRERLAHEDGCLVSSGVRDQADDGGRHRPARRRRKDRSRRGDPDLRAVFPAQEPSGDGAAAPGTPRRDPALSQFRNRAPHQGAQDDASVHRHLQGFRPGGRAGDEVPVHLLRLQSARSGGRGRVGSELRRLHARAHLGAAGHERHANGRSRRDHP